MIQLEYCKEKRRTCKMKNKKILSTSLSLGLSLALLIGNVSSDMNNVKVMLV